MKRFLKLTLITILGLLFAFAPATTFAESQPIDKGFGDSEFIKAGDASSSKATLKVL